MQGHGPYQLQASRPCCLTGPGAGAVHGGKQGGQVVERGAGADDGHALVAQRSQRLAHPDVHLPHEGGGQPAASQWEAVRTRMGAPS